MATAVASVPNGAAQVLPPQRNLIRDMAARIGVDAVKLVQSIKSTAFTGSDDEFLAFMVVADQYGLNPFTREIYAFPKRGGGIQNVVSVDGWANIINSHPQMNGVTFEDHTNDKGELIAITCRIHRKDRQYPAECTEYMEECRRGGDTPWKTWPRRMLRHKALIQCARYAFGFSGLVDPDEAERVNMGTTVTPAATVHAKAKPSTANALLSAPKPQEYVEADYTTEEVQPEPAAEPTGEMSDDERTLASFEQLLETTDSVIKADSFRDKAKKEHEHLAVQIDQLTEQRIAAIKGKGK